MFRIFDTIAFTLERIRQHTVLVMWVVVGLTVATTLSLSLSLYVDSVYTELLASQLDDPPYAYQSRYLGAWNGNISADDVQTTDTAIRHGFSTGIGLPVERFVTFTRGGSWNTQVQTDSGTGANLGVLSPGVLVGADDMVEVINGAWPADPADFPNTIPVLIPQTMFYDMGISIGDTLTSTRAGGGSTTFEVAAVWQPVDADDPAWIFPPTFFNTVLLLGSGDFWTLLDGIESPVDEAAWHTIFDGSDVRTSDVNGLLANMVSATRDLDRVLPDIRHTISPREGLEAFNAEVNQLTQQLFIIIAPVGGLVLYFVALVAGLLVNRQTAEDVKLRSRGMSRRALLGVHLLMWLSMVGAALAISLGIGPLLVRLVGQTSSFLRFDGASSVETIVITRQAVLLGAMTGLIAASSGIFLAWRTTTQNINSYRRETARSRQAWWQRAYFDVMLLFPAGYVLYTLVKQGGLQTSVDTPFSDPLAFVGPTLFALGCALLFLRIWPFFLNIAGKLISYTSNIAFLMTMRELTRSIGRYRGALLMMAFTLSLTGFTASMANTLDASLADTIDYRVGADVVLVTAVDAETTDPDAETGEQEVTGYNVPPVESLFDVEGVAFASRMGEYNGQMTIGNQRLTGSILGVDRTQLAAVARFRDDFADENLAALLNKLANDRTGILINRQTAELYNLIPGQRVTLGVQALDTWFETRVTVIDFVDYFPTLDPADGFFAIGNIDPIFELVGTALPHDVWLTLDEGYSLADVQPGIREAGFPVLRWLDPNIELEAARAEPARRGVLGFLSVGFVASITLTLIAAIIQSTASFRAQSAQLGALRAMGLGSGAVSRYVISLQSLSAISGIGSGTLIGVATTLLFLPLLDFSGGLPPYLVRVAWDEIAVVYAAFAAVLFGVTLLTTLILSREQLATVVRLGEG